METILVCLEKHHLRLKVSSFFFLVEQFFKFCSLVSSRNCLTRALVFACGLCSGRDSKLPYQISSLILHSWLRAFQGDPRFFFKLCAMTNNNTTVERRKREHEHIHEHGFPCSHIAYLRLPFHPPLWLYICPPLNWAQSNQHMPVVDLNCFHLFFFFFFLMHFSVIVGAGLWNQPVLVTQQSILC